MQLDQVEQASIPAAVPRPLKGRREKGEDTSTAPGLYIFMYKEEIPM